MSDRRVGLGIDFHRFTADRPLILGGVSVPHEQGLLGHSDADVLTHAICDALLGAAGLGDIGVHFPDSDEAYRGASSIGLLGEVMAKVRDAGLRSVNVDATVIAEEPKLTPHFAEMREILSRALGIEAGLVGLKATTSEGMGAVGRGEGIAAFAVALIETG
ncbi:MAG: 2-C-methyl-D-erythritol 2,4-cyclodiphosphate synthase [Candidatus Bipolaricaulia bacterium]